MAFNGSGTYNRTNGTFSGTTVWAQDAAAAAKITTARHDTHDQDVATALTNTVCKDGQSTPTANLPMGGFKHTNTAVASARTDYLRASQGQDSTLLWGGVSTGAANTYAITLTPAITAYADGQRFQFVAHQDNTTSAPTLNINSVGAVSIKKFDGGALEAFEIGNGVVTKVTYYSGAFWLEMSGPTTRTWTPTLTTNVGTYTSSSATFATYKNIGGAILFCVSFTGTTGGSAPNQLIFSLPATIANRATVCSAVYFDGGSSLGGMTEIVSTSTLAVMKPDRSNFGLGAGRGGTVYGWALFN